MSAGWIPHGQEPIGFVMVNGKETPVRANPSFYRYLNTLANNTAALAAVVAVIQAAGLTGADEIPPVER